MAESVVTESTSNDRVLAEAPDTEIIPDTGNFSVNFGNSFNAMQIEYEFQMLLKQELADNELKETLFRLEDSILSLASAGDCIGIFYMMPIQFQVSNGTPIIYVRFFEHGNLQGVMLDEVQEMLNIKFNEAIFPVKIFTSWDVKAHKHHLEQRKRKKGSKHRERPDQVFVQKIYAGKQGWVKSSPTALASLSSSEKLSVKGTSFFAVRKLSAKEDKKNKVKPIDGRITRPRNMNLNSLEPSHVE